MSHWDLARRPAAVIGAAIVAAAAGVAAAGAAEVNVYTYREQPLIKPIFDQFTKETGIKVNVVFSNKGLEERIKAEGAASPADLFIAVDVALLDRAKSMDITQPLRSPLIDKAVPAQFRDPGHAWVGFTYRARVIYASKDRVKDAAFTYADLADPKWKGKVCTRSGQHPYNLALISAVIAHVGPEQAEAWLRGVKQNLTGKPSGNDRSQAKAIMTGECDIAIANTYYYGLMTTNDREPEQKDWAKAVRVVLPTFDGGGTHVNLSGAVLAKHAPNRDNAVRLVDFMLGQEAQKLYADLNFEYPVVGGVAVDPIIAGLGALEPDRLNLGDLARYRTKASELVDKVGFDAGPAS